MKKAYALLLTTLTIVADQDQLDCLAMSCRIRSRRKTYHKKPSTPLYPPSHTATTNIPTASPLSKMPQELLDKIFHHSITDGELAIMRVSKAVHLRTRRLFEKAGRWKVEVKETKEMNGCWMATQPLKNTRTSQVKPLGLPWTAASRISNVEFHIDLMNTRDMSYILDDFFDLVARTKQDCLTIVLKNFNPASLPACGNRILPGSLWIRPFKRVMVTAIANEVLNAAGEEQNRWVLRARNRRMYDLVKKEWEPVLGLSTWHNASCQEDCYIEFKPEGHLPR